MKKYEKYQESYDPRLGAIPANWQLTALKRVTGFKYGDALQEETRDDEGSVNVYGSNGIVGKHNSAITQAPCIIIGRKGSYGKVNYSTEPCFPIDTAYFIDQSVTGHEIRFIYYLLQTCELDTNSRDSAVPGLSREEAYNKKVGLPPLPEQRAIAAYLDHKTVKLDMLLVQKETLLQKLHLKRQAIINEAVTQGLDPDAPRKPSGVAWLGDVPAHWEVKKLKYVAHINPLKNIAEDADDTVTFLPMEKVSDRGEIDCSQKRPVKELLTGFTYFEKNDVIVAKITPCFENGKGAYLDQLDTDFGFGSTEFHVIRASEKLYAAFLYYLTTSSKFRDVGEGSMTGSGGQKRVPTSFVENFPLALPSYEEQGVIVGFIKAKISKINEATTAIHTQIKTLKAYRQSLISEVVTGKVDVRPAVLPPEADLPLWQQ